MDASKIDQAVSAARFYLEWPNPRGVDRIAISEVSNIQSKVAAQEYIYNDHVGETHYTKQFGKSEPPTVSIKRALDKEGSAAMLMLHALARGKSKDAVSDARIIVMDSAGKEAETYILTNAWVSELSIQGLKAGDSQVATMDAKITCEEITTDGVNLLLK